MAHEQAHGGGRGTDGDDESSVARRGYLTLCGTVTAIGALAGFSSPSAATNLPEDPSSTADEHTLVVAGTGDASSFEVTVSDHISPLAPGDALSTTGTVGPAAEGVVTGDTRRYRFFGDITNFRSDGAVSVYVDGVRVLGDAF
jgi:hypothetical protein